MSVTARQIVSKMLEDEMFSGPRPGSPEDPWRQSKGPLSSMNFAPRPGAAPEPDSEALPPEEEEVPPANPLEQVPPPPAQKLPIQPGMKSRFKWLPPTPGP